MCGGSSGDGGAADRERQRQERIARGTLAINSLFGKGSGDAAIADAKARIDQASEMINGGKPGGNRLTGVVSQAAGNNLKTSATEDLANATTYAQINAQAKSAREALYGDVRDDTRDYFAKQLERDKEDAARAQKFALARAGTFSSSQAIDEGRKFQDKLDEGLLEVANRADTASTNLRTADEKTRLSLIDRLVSGVDQGTVMTSALDQLNTNADNERNQATSARMGNVFADLTALYNQNQFNAGGQAARSRYQQQFGNVFPNADGGYSGTQQKVG